MWVGACSESWFMCGVCMLGGIFVGCALFRVLYVSRVLGGIFVCSVELDFMFPLYVLGGIFVGVCFLVRAGFYFAMTKSHMER